MSYPIDLSSIIYSFLFLFLYSVFRTSPRDFLSGTQPYSITPSIQFSYIPLLISIYYYCIHYDLVTHARELSDGRWAVTAQAAVNIYPIDTHISRYSLLFLASFVVICISKIGTLGLSTSQRVCFSTILYVKGIRSVI